MTFLVIFLVLLLGLIFSGGWLGVALGGTGMILLYFFGGGWSSLNLMVSSTWNMLTNFALTAIPMYIILGQIIVATKLSRRIYDSLSPLFERLPGGLLHTNVVVCALFGAVTGASNSCLAAIGSIAYPELRDRNYRRDACAASLAGSSTLALIIPPSITLILIGAWQEISVPELFMAVLVPGILITLIFMAYTAFSSSIRKDIAPRVSKEERMPLIRALWYTKGSWPLAVIIVAVLVTIYLGIATPTEAGGLGIAATIILAVIFRTCDWKAVGGALYESARLFGIISLVFFGAVILSISVSIMGLPRELVMMVQASGLPNIVILILLYVLYIILGMFFDPISFMVMTLPFAFPLVVSLGYDPLWFGVMMVMVSMIGMLTPPVGILLYMMVAISKGEVSLGELARETVPYWILILVGLAIITAFPEICLWLPRMM